MKYIFDGEFQGTYPVECFQVCLYDGMDGGCYDEYCIKPEDFSCHDLSSVETEEEQAEKGDHSRLFVHMKNGDTYELELRKLSKKQVKEASWYNYRKRA